MLGAEKLKQDHVVFHLTEKMMNAASVNVPMHYVDEEGNEVLFPRRGGPKARVPLRNCSFGRTEKAKVFHKVKDRKLIEFYRGNLSALADGPNGKGIYYEVDFAKEEQARNAAGLESVKAIEALSKFVKPNGKFPPQAGRILDGLMASLFGELEADKDVAYSKLILFCATKPEAIINAIESESVIYTGLIARMVSDGVLGRVKMGYGIAVDPKDPIDKMVGNEKAIISYLREPQMNEKARKFNDDIKLAYKKRSLEAPKY